MPSPFPGMDPYLESPAFWSEVHNRLIVAIADDLAPKLRPRYRVAIEQRIYLSSPDEMQLIVPDVTVTQQSIKPQNFGVATIVAPVSQPISIELEMPEEMRESYLKVREVESGRVVTVLELLSPKNKQGGEGRSAYERKRQQTLASTTHFVEIDLLRRGRSFPLGQITRSAGYYVLVARGDRRPHGDLYSFGLRDFMPSFPMPLEGSDEEPMVMLQSLFDGVYDRAGFDLAIDYDRPMPKPLLSEEDSDWVEEVVRSTSRNNS
jgi:Protein of unknown function (DUF4058)